MRGRKPNDILVTDDAVDMTKAPAWLSSYAKSEWRRVAPILGKRRTITAPDLGILESYCTASGTVREMQEVIGRDGAIITTDKGPKKHPALAIQNAAMTTARLCAAELGLTPVSRSRPSIREDKDPDDISPLDL